MICDYCKRKVPPQRHKLDCPYKSTASGTTRTVLQMFADSSRGHLLMGQALAYAIDALENVKPYPEESNIRDMQALGNLFEPYFTLYQAKIKGNLPTIL